VESCDGTRAARATAAYVSGAVPLKIGMAPRRRELGCRLGPYVRSGEKQMCLDRGPVLIDGREGAASHSERKRRGDRNECPRACRRRGPRRADMQARSPWSWAPPRLHVCAMCGMTALTREPSPRCGRCGSWEDE